MNVASKMTIGLDFDGTISEDPVTWYNICKLLKEAGHKVYIVTMRYPEEVVEDYTHHRFDSVVEDIIYTHRKAKRPYVENLGINIGIWIDDNPRAVNESAAQIWPTVFPKGHVQDTISEPDVYSNYEELEKTFIVTGRGKIPRIPETEIFCEEFFVVSTENTENMAITNLKEQTLKLVNKIAASYDDFHVFCRGINTQKRGKQYVASSILGILVKIDGKYHSVDFRGHPSGYNISVAT